MIGIGSDKKKGQARKIDLDKAASKRVYQAEFFQPGQQNRYTHYRRNCQWMDGQIDAKHDKGSTKKTVF